MSTAFALNQVNFKYGSMEEAFPEVDPNIEPYGSRVLVQLRKPKSKTKGGVFLTAETKETERWNEQVAKVIAIGPLAFCNRNTRETWPEGRWALPNTFVRVPKHGGDRWSVTHGEGDDKEEIIFAMFADHDLLGRIPDPLSMKSFI